MIRVAAIVGAVSAYARTCPCLLGLAIQRTRCPGAIAPPSGVRVLARHDRFCSRGCSGLAMPLPREEQRGFGRVLARLRLTLGAAADESEQSLASSGWLLNRQAMRE